MIFFFASFQIHFFTHKSGNEKGGPTIKKKLGIIVNPIAGMGGAVGLKGTDGVETLKKAIEMGAKPLSPERAKEFLNELKPVQNLIEVITSPGKMGANEALEVGFKPKIIGKIAKKTTEDDTKNVVKMMLKEEVDLLVICGGDGTTIDVLEAMDPSMPIPVLGVPTGVKMHSAVFAINPKAAAKIALQFLWDELPLREAEVMDVDEEAFRQGRLSADLKGFLMVPYEPSLLQGAKVGSPTTADERLDREAIAKRIVEEMDPETLYILSAGTTVKAITDEIGVEKTLLGADLLQNKEIIKQDVNEQQILEVLKKKGDCKIIVSPIGHQGFIFGRGNQQISSKVIRQVGLKNIIIVATPFKLSTLDILRVDTGNPDLDNSLKGYIRVVSGYHETNVVRVE
jgi:predicted polyphosphate/ATP-dependent NAD kinase